MIMAERQKIMKEKTEKTQYKKMTETPVSRLIMNLSIPAIISMLVTNIYNLADTREIVPWEVTYPTGAKWGFNAFVKSFKDGEKTPDGLLTFSSGLRVSGKPTFTMSNNSSSNNASQGG